MSVRDTSRSNYYLQHVGQPDQQVDGVGSGVLALTATALAAPPSLEAASWMSTMSTLRAPAALLSPPAAALASSWTASPAATPEPANKEQHKGWAGQVPTKARKRFDSQEGRVSHSKDQETRSASARRSDD